MKIVEKPWGREEWIAVTDKYALKIIYIKKGTRSSLQLHKLKHEHIYIDQGKVRMELEQPDGTMAVQEFGPGTVVENPPGRKHRTEAVEDALPAKGSCRRIAAFLGRQVPAENPGDGRAQLRSDAEPFLDALHLRPELLRLLLVEFIPQRKSG